MVSGMIHQLACLGRTKDFESYERIEIITAPKNRGASYFQKNKWKIL